MFNPVSSGGSYADTDALAAVGAATGEPTGFVDASECTLTYYNESPDRTLRIAPVGDSFSVDVQGVRYTFTEAQDIQHPDTDGVHYIYLDDAGAWQTTQVFSSSIIQEYAFAAIVYRDSGNESSRVFDERHGNSMPGATHAHLHTTMGALYVSGMAITGITADGSGDLDAHYQFGIEAGTYRDEDILHSVAAKAFPGSWTMLYREGTTGLWKWQSISSRTFKTTGSGRAAWNEWTGVTWQQAEAPNGDCVLTHVFATNDTASGADVVLVQGQATYPSLAQARAGALSEIRNLLVGDLPSPEFCPIATIIGQTGNGYSTVTKTRIRSTGDGADYVDWRGRTLVASENVSGASGVTEIKVRGNTSGAETVDIWSFELADDQTIVMECQVGTDNGTERCIETFTAAAWKYTGSNIGGNTLDKHTALFTTAGLAASIGLTNPGTVNLRVTGVGGADLTWDALIRYRFIRP